MGDLGPCHVRFLSYDEELKRKTTSKISDFEKNKNTLWLHFQFFRI
jgi:hypothetical protein